MPCLESHSSSCSKPVKVLGKTRCLSLLLELMRQTLNFSWAMSIPSIDSVMAVSSSCRIRCGAGQTCRCKLSFTRKRLRILSDLVRCGADAGSFSNRLTLLGHNSGTASPASSVAQACCLSRLQSTYKFGRSASRLAIWFTVVNSLDLSFNILGG